MTTTFAPPHAAPEGKRKRPRPKPKGRQIDIGTLEEIRTLLGSRSRRRDLLIEHLHLIQDKFGHLSAGHLAALAEEMKLAQTEVYEVATFYAHFDVVKEGETPPPATTVRVCDSLSCCMAGADKLLAELPGKLGKDVRVVRAANDGLRFICRKIEGYSIPEKYSETDRQGLIKRWKDWYKSVNPAAVFLD